uniref:Uncharacterized protein n=1 Tax=Heterorhabditis bacteriophora TaxID=37862 RepID=A0A1I7WR51_HETBA
MVIPSTLKGHNNNNTLQHYHHNDEVKDFKSNTLSLNISHHMYNLEHKNENGAPRADLISGISTNFFFVMDKFDYLVTSSKPY